MFPLRQWILASTAQLLLVAIAVAAGEQQFAEFPDCPLTSGESIRDCRVGYRTFGVLNEAGSNAILFPSWFGGTTEELVSLGYVGPGRFADTDRYFVVLVDAFGNGISTSPSNSVSQHGSAYPDLRIDDMVTAQYRLITETLGIRHLHAVIGISMGGMQTFEWIVRYPDFMNKAVSVIGTPRQTSYDLLLWNAQLGAIENLADDDYENTLRIVAALDSLTSYTPMYIATNTPASGFQDFMDLSIRSVREKGLENRVPQLRAMIRQDISLRFSGSMRRAADVVVADLLIVISPEDQMVNPQPSREFAELSGATLRELSGACGHLAVACDRDSLTKIVRDFLDPPGSKH